MMDKRTFDCDYGRHALVLRRGEDGPAFGRIDVAQLVAMFGEAVFMPEAYVPKHAKEDRRPDWTRQGMTAAEWHAAGRPNWTTNNPGRAK
jgi:hypothetical protein